jgi:beta-lactamase class C
MIKKLCLLLFIILSNIAYADENLSNTADIKQNITALVEKYHVPGVAVEVYQDGKLISYYVGDANREKKKPVNKNTIFELGSLTDLMTSILLAQEFDAAKIQWNAPVKKFIPALNSDDFEDITVQSLATYTSGLPFDAPATIKTQAELYQYLNNWYPDYVTDEAWLYSPLSMRLLSDVLEQQSKQKINDLYRRRIFSPLGMQPLGLHVPSASQANFAQGYDTHDLPVTSADSQNVKVSAADMQKFLSAAIGLSGTPESILYPMRMTQAAYIKLPARKQGLGWEIYSLEPSELGNLSSVANTQHTEAEHVVEVYNKAIFKTNDLLEKSGNTAGFTAYIALIPGKKTGIVILMNKQISKEDVVDTGRKILFKLANIQTDVSAVSDATTTQ